VLSKGSEAKVVTEFELGSGWLGEERTVKILEVGKLRL
jgi:hypothetical protein